jgi:RNA polymerase sigma factor (sigma-70 family)
MTTSLFTQLINEYSDRLFHYLLKLGVPKEDSNDIMQNCFESIWKKDFIDFEESRKYLFGVAYKQSANYYRLKDRKGHSNLAEMESPIYANNILSVTTHQALNQLTSQQRSLLLLKDLEGYSYEEIASITGLNNSQVKVYLHRARLKMQELLGSLKSVI